MSPLLSVIIVSYNTRAMTLECLRDLHAGLQGMPAEVFVVDNASQDESAQAVREAYPAVHVVANERNVGFGAANNRAMQRAAGRYLLLLNSDAFPRPGALPAMVAALEDDATLGVVGPRLLNADGSLQVSCYRDPTPGRAWLENLWLSRLAPAGSRWGDYAGWAHDEPRRVDWLVGACLLVRREVFERVGGFDPGFFMYAEEADWQKRIRAAGWGIGFTPSAEVTHLGGASGAAERVRINQHFFNSLDYYEWKHHGLVGLVSLRLAMAVGCSMRLALWLGAWATRPGRRSLAKAKARLHGWLVVRQLTHWSLAFPKT